MTDQQRLDELDADGYPIAQFATGDGPLSETTLSCPRCDETFTGATRNAAQRRRSAHARAECFANVTNEARHLKKHDQEQADG
jgi:uncharacterized C2H2 Zn-finger protein